MSSNNFRKEKDSLGELNVPADALYGVSMRADGISAVVGQRVGKQEAS